MQHWKPASLYWKECCQEIDRLTAAYLQNYSLIPNTYIPQLYGELLFSIEAIEVYHYKSEGKHSMLIVPSLINGPEIWDLRSANSMAAHLVEQGVNVYLVHWGNSGRYNYSWEEYQDIIAMIIKKLPTLSVVLGHCLAARLVADAAIQERKILLAPPVEWPEIIACNAPITPELALECLRIYFSWPRYYTELLYAQQIFSEEQRAINNWLNRPGYLSVKVWQRLQQRHYWEVMNHDELLVVTSKQDKIAPVTRLHHLWPNAIWWNIPGGHLSPILQKELLGRMCLNLCCGAIE